MVDSRELLKLFVDNGISCSIAEFKGNSIAIDVSSWLHKALCSHVEDLIDIEFRDYMLYVDFLIYRARNFRMAGVEPVMVFSGHCSYLKSSRQAIKDDDLQHLACIEQGKRLLDSMKASEDVSCRQKLRNEAIICFQRGLVITPQIEKNCISALRRVGVTVIVAPYEADAQLASLCRSGVCQAVLTEDYNLILYSAISEKPFPILYRFDSTGMVQVVSLSSFAAAKRPLQINNQTPNKKNNSSNKTSNNNNNSSSASSVAVFHPPLASSINTSTSSNNEKLLIFLCKLLSNIHGRRQFLQICLLLGNDYIEPIIDGITFAMVQKLIIKFSDVHPDSRLAMIKTYLDTSEGMSDILGQKQNTLTTTLSNTSSTSNFFSLPSSFFPYTKPRSSKMKADYFDRLHRTELMIYYHPIYDLKLKCIRNYSTPNYGPALDMSDSVCLDMTRNSNAFTSSNDCRSKSMGGEAQNNGVITSEQLPVYPVINFNDLFRLGHTAHVLYGVPSALSENITIENLCEGRYSMHDFSVIEPSLPWEHSHIAHFSSQKLDFFNRRICNQNRHNRQSSSSSSTTGSAAKESNSSLGHVYKGVWHNRSVLVRFTAAYIPNLNPLTNLQNSNNDSTVVSNTPFAVHSILTLSHKGPSIPPPSSSIFDEDLQSVSLEQCKKIEVSPTPADTEDKRRFKTITEPRVSNTSTSSRAKDSICTLEDSYASPPTRKSPTDHIEKHLGNASDSSIAKVIISSSSVNRNNSIRIDSVLDCSGSIGSQDVPQRTPPALSSADTIPMPLSPDHMRLATISSVHSPIIERENYHTTTTNSCAISDSEHSHLPSSKRKYSDVVEVDATCSKGSSKKKKTLMVASIKSFFKASSSTL